MSPCHDVTTSPPNLRKGLRPYTAGVKKIITGAVVGVGVEMLISYMV